MELSEFFTEGLSENVGAWSWSSVGLVLAIVKESSFFGGVEWLFFLFWPF
jgi:hypothetical protein